MPLFDFICSILNLTLPFRYFKVKNNVKCRKNIQINGSLGHDDYNKNIRKTVKNLNFSNFFNGLPIRMANSACYVGLSILMGRIGS